MKLATHDYIVELFKEAQPKSKCLHCHFAHYINEEMVGCRMTGEHRHYKSCKYFVDFDEERQRMADCFNQGKSYCEPYFNPSL